MADSIDSISDWPARLRSRLYAQFRSKTTHQAWADFLGAQQQVVENVTQQLLSLTNIDESEGVQLDAIGRVIGQPRLGELDPTYRLYLKARILANRSTGTVENIFAVIRALFGTGVALPIYIPGLVKQFAVRVRSVVTRTGALVTADFLGVAKDAGARGILEWQESPSDEMFTLWDMAVLTTPIIAGSVITSIDVTSTDGYPAFGDMKFGDEQANFFMNGKTATSFTTSIPALQPFSYEAGTPVGMWASEVGEVDVGLDEGNFAGAIEA